MTESKNPRLGEGFVVTEDALRTALDEFRANLIAMAMLEAPPAPQELCADCKHPKSDSRFHLEAPGDNWGAALHHFVPAPASQPVSAPAEKKEWVTAGDLCVQIHLKLTASSQSKHFGWLVGALELAEVRAALKEAQGIIEIIKDTPYRCHAPDDKDFHSGCVQTKESIIDNVRKSIVLLRSREAELLARGGGK